MKKGNAKDWTSGWRGMILENGSYKLVALFVTLILWVTILGRRDFQLSKDMQLEFLLPPNLAIASDTPERKVSVKVSGPRSAINRFLQDPGSITIDLGRSQVGNVRALIQPKNIETPFGVRVVSITPESVVIHLISSHAGEADTSAAPTATPSSR